MSVHQMLKLAIVGFGLFLAADAKAAITHVTHNLNLRSGPDTTYPPVAIVPAGALIDVLDCGSTWCHVHWASHLGYVNGYYLSSHVTVVVAPIVKEHDSLRFGRVCPYCGREHENRCYNVPVKLVREVHDRWPKDLLIASRRNRSDQPITPEES